MARIINLTPHPISIMDETEKIMCTIPPSGTVARVSQQRISAGTIDVDGVKIPVVKTVYGEVEGLPDKPEPDTYYIVSTIVAQAIIQQKPEFMGHILTPDTGPGSAMRDSQGRIIGVKYLIRW
ncbi:MAG: hypothetical protein GXO43_03245 [Crenarchaeota archaeon]|nr:hypothetical protein [Thermoproteota archaeon]